MRSPSTGVSFVMPVYNGRRWLCEALDAIDAQRDGRPFEVIVVDDGSRDGSRRILEEAVRSGRVTVIDGPGRGIAAAINAGVREARYPIICQVDQDVILAPGGSHTCSRRSRILGWRPLRVTTARRRTLASGPA